MSRPISARLAPLVELLELERPQIVTLADLAVMLDALQLTMTPKKAAFRLREDGWLLPTGVRAAYEFAPAERAGPISQGDALLAVRAVLSEAPSVRVAAALGTALALHNIADRGPDIPELAFPKAATIPRPLRGLQFRTLRFDWSLPTASIQGLPVHRAATVLVHLAHRPTEVRSWAAMLEALPSLLAASSIEEIRAELRGRPHATHVRLAYLTHGLAPNLVSTLAVVPRGTVWFGPRTTLKRYNGAWKIADTILPFAPDALSSRTRGDLSDR